MRQLTQISFLMAIILMLGSCDLFEEEEAEDNGDPDPLEFATQPNDALSSMIEETPSDFTWGYFQDNVRVNMVPGSMWSGELVLTSFQVRNGGVVNRTTSEAVATSTGELANGLSTEELFPGSEWVPGAMWVPANSWVPVNSWIPGMEWVPSEVEDVAIAENDLGENQTMVVVYAHVVSTDREVTTQPFGITFNEQN